LQNEKKMKKRFRNYGLVYQLCGILAIEDRKKREHERGKAHGRAARWTLQIKTAAKTEEAEQDSRTCTEIACTAFA
ncbi:hypothetical protein, partial [Hominenteromicrobium sp.]|uniref:hypothetical protein n=1 Tax=Hominenteromicrobium sp. TaxID=3073581 RepID=UPI003AB799B2